MDPENDFTFTTRINEESTTQIASTSKAAPSAGPSFNAPARLEPILLLAKSARGAGAARLIEQAVAAPGVFAFSEILDMPNIKDLSSNTEYASHIALLQLFAFGTYKDYKNHSDAYPELKESAVNKLKQLTIVTLSSKSRILPYSLLLAELDIASVRELEDLIIDAIYANLLTGRLDQLKARLSIDSVTGRDVQVLEPLKSVLIQWSNAINEQISYVDQRINQSRSIDSRKAQSKAAAAAHISKTIEDLSTESKKGGGTAFSNDLRSPRKGRSHGKETSMDDRTARREQATGVGENDMDVDDQLLIGGSPSKAKQTRKRGRT